MADDKVAASGTQSKEDPIKVAEEVVNNLKSQGLFDQFRRECLEELENMESYRLLKQRVENHVASFLSKFQWTEKMSKNSVRDSLRTNINRSEVLLNGVERLIDQILSGKTESFSDRIGSEVDKHLGIERKEEPAPGTVVDDSELVFSSVGTTIFPPHSLQSRASKPTAISASSQSPTQLPAQSNQQSKESNPQNAKLVTCKSSATHSSNVDRSLTTQCTVGQSGKLLCAPSKCTTAGSLVTSNKQLQPSILEVAKIATTKNQSTISKCLNIEEEAADSLNKADKKNFDKTLINTNNTFDCPADCEPLQASCIIPGNENDPGTVIVKTDEICDINQVTPNSSSEIKPNYVITSISSTETVEVCTIPVLGNVLPCASNSGFEKGCAEVEAERSQTLNKNSKAPKVHDKLVKPKESILCPDLRNVEEIKEEEQFSIEKETKTSLCLDTDKANHTERAIEVLDKEKNESKEDHMITSHPNSANDSDEVRSPIYDLLQTKPSELPAASDASFGSKIVKREGKHQPNQSCVDHSKAPPENTTKGLETQEEKNIMVKTSENHYGDPELKEANASAVNLEPVTANDVAPEDEVEKTATKNLEHMPKCDLARDNTLVEHVESGKNSQIEQTSNNINTSKFSTAAQSEIHIEDFPFNEKSNPTTIASGSESVTDFDLSSDSSFGIGQRMIRRRKRLISETDDELSKGKLAKITDLASGDELFPDEQVKEKKETPISAEIKIKRGRGRPRKIDKKIEETSRSDTEMLLESCTGDDSVEKNRGRTRTKKRDELEFFKVGVNKREKSVDNESSASDSLTDVDTRRTRRQIKPKRCYSPSDSK